MDLLRNNLENVEHHSAATVSSLGEARSLAVDDEPGWVDWLLGDDGGDYCDQEGRASGLLGVGSVDEEGGG